MSDGFVDLCTEKRTRAGGQATRTVMGGTTPSTAAQTIRASTRRGRHPQRWIDQNCDGSDLIVGSGTLQFTLIWTNDNDQDLHVIEPSGPRIWYGSPGSTGPAATRRTSTAAGFG